VFQKLAEAWGGVHDVGGQSDLTTFLVTVVTMTGEQAVKAVEITQARTAIPIHYNDFSVFMSGLDDFRKAAQAWTTSPVFVYLAHGETYTFTPTV
jgi:L-ascorbate metabolism protein UlaG (beta-lactamase superfamily)